MKLILSSLLVLISFCSIAAQPKNVQCIKEQIKKNKTLEQAYQICSVKK